MNLSRWPKADTRQYLGVSCRRCRAPILFALDQSEGENQSLEPRRLFLTCQNLECLHQDDYSSAKMARYQKTSESTKSEARSMIKHPMVPIKSPNATHIASA